MAIFSYPEFLQNLLKRLVSRPSAPSDIVIAAAVGVIIGIMMLVVLVIFMMIMVIAFLGV